ncbi:hypothetical protein DPMN_121346, partial [Dreissena polymorpha]
IIETIILTKSDEDPTQMMPIVKNAPPPGGHVFQPTGTIFELILYIIRTNILTKLHKDRTINPYKEKCSSLGSHVFQPTGTIYQVVQDIIGTYLLTMFHEDRKRNVAFSVLRQMMTLQNAQRTKAHHEHIVLSSIKINILTKFHED